MLEQWRADDGRMDGPPPFIDGSACVIYNKTDMSHQCMPGWHFDVHSLAWWWLNMKLINESYNLEDNWSWGQRRRRQATRMAAHSTQSCHQSGTTCYGGQDSIAPWIVTVTVWNSNTEDRTRVSQSHHTQNTTTIRRIAQAAAALFIPRIDPLDSIIVRRLSYE